MGRTIWLLSLFISDDNEGEIRMSPSDELKIKLSQLYDTDEYCWTFSEYGSVEWNGFNPLTKYSKCYVFGDIEDHIKILLATAKELGHTISGTLSYYDSQSTTAYHGLFYVYSNYTAVHYKFDVGVSFECPNNLESIHTTEIITIN
jgi:hypothetical protein